MRKVNGMVLEEFFAELAKPIPTAQKEGSDTSYFRVGDVERRLRELILPCNYNFSCTPPVLQEVRNSACFSLVGTLEILDDEGNRVLIRQVPSGEDIAFSQADQNKSARPLKSMISTAKSYAFVNCWLEAGFASSVELSWKPDKKSSENEKEYEVEFTSNLSVRGDMVTATVKVDGRTVDFRVFKEGLAFFEKNNKTGKTLSRQEVSSLLVKNYGVSKVKTLRCVGYFSTYRGQEQFVLTKGVS